MLDGAWALDDPRVATVPLEHWTAAGMAPGWAVALRARRGWDAGRIALFDAGVRRYWQRSTALARRDRHWPPPRRRHVVVVERDPLAVRPWVQLLGTSAWLLYADDLDPARSHPELLAWLLAVGDRMAATGEVTMAAVQAAAWWLVADDAAASAFGAAARRVRRPDAAAVAATADAVAWMRRLHHETLRPPPAGPPERPIPGTGLLVPRALEAEPPRLVGRWVAAAEGAVSAWRGRWRREDGDAVAALGRWLADDVPPLLVTERDTLLWDPDVASRTAPLEAALAHADGVAVAAMRDDLAVVARHGRAFLDAVVDPATLPAAAPEVDAEQRGYSHLHPGRRLVAYDVAEPGMERRQGPPLPWARAMLAARTAHEWGHLADAAGFVARTVDEVEWARRVRRLGALFDDTVAAAPSRVRRATAADLSALAREAPTAGAALARIALARLPDWRANLVARAFLSDLEAEVYARHNVRALSSAYPPAARWRRLARPLYEYQYLRPALGFVRLDDPRAFLFDSTWVADDLVAPGFVDGARFDALAEAVGACCEAHAVDPARLRPRGAAGRPDPRQLAR